VNEEKNAIRKSAKLIALGFELAAPVVVGALGGYYLDSKLNSLPWLMLLGTIGGFLCGLRTLFNILKKL
jgi:F0F1-type ATP synthase assembly protein I